MGGPTWKNYLVLKYENINIIAAYNDDVHGPPNERVDMKIPSIPHDTKPS